MQRSSAVLTVLSLFLFAAVAPGFASAQNMQFTPWVEPSTQLVYAEVPQGWQAQGTIIDVAGVPQANIVAVSPDQAAVVIAGLNQPFIFAEPNPALGLTEGGSFAVGAMPISVLSRMTPDAFLREYLNMILVSGGTCSSIDVQAQPTQQIDATTAGGMVSLTCVYAGGQASGAFTVNIYSLQDQALGALWIPADLFGYLADPGHEAAAEQAMLHLASTLSVDVAQYQANAGLMQQPQGDAGMMPGDAALDPMDTMMAQQLNQQVDQMMRSHMIQTFNNQMYWNCVNTATIYGTPADCGGGTTTQNQYEYDYDGDGQPGW